jgi:hypothetical protein
MRALGTGRRWRVASVAGLLAAFVGCSDGGPTVDKNIKTEAGKSVEESTKATRVNPAAKKQDAAPAQRKGRGPE